MLRLKPIRKTRRRGPSDKVLRIADGAFWVVLVFAASFGAGRLATGFPKFIGLFVSPVAGEAQASIPPTSNVVDMSLPAMPPLGTTDIRTSIATDDVNIADRTIPSGPPMIAIVIDDLGADAVHTRRAIELPRAVALSFLPYPDDTPRLAREGRKAGHEILVHVPMEAVGPQRPEPMALMIGLSPEENMRRLGWALDRVPGYIGVNNHEGSRFTADANALAPMMQALATRRVFFFDSRTTPDTQAVQVANAYGVTVASRDVFLDDIENIDAIDAQLHALEKRAKEQGVAIAIGHPREITLDAVAYWVTHQSGFSLAPLSEAIAHENGARMSLALLRR